MTKRTLAEIEAYLASWPEPSRELQERWDRETALERERHRAEMAKIGVNIDYEAQRKHTEWCIREYERLQAEE